MSLCDTCRREKCINRRSTVFGCSNYVKKVQTNADRIRAMSDEELAEYFADMGTEASNGISYSERPEEWLEWLKQPAEDEL